MTYGLQNEIRNRKKDYWDVSLMMRVKDAIPKQEVKLDDLWVTK